LGKGNWEFARFEPGSKSNILPYTREELRDLERFSQERGVHIVPEIDMPGHACRLVGDAQEVFGFPGSGATLNIAKSKTLEAITALWNEVMDVFQGTPYIHIGGDEVGLGGLEGTAEYKELQRKFPQIKSSHDLYCKFMRDMHEVFAKRGKKMIVWEEAFNPGGPFPLPKDTLIMVWCQGRNPADIVKEGDSVINATWTPLYIVRDNRKTFEFLFNWEIPKFGSEASNDFFALKDTEKLAGVQLCSWENSEAIEIQSTRDRLAVVAEKAWNPQAGGTFDQFNVRWGSSDFLLEKLVNPITIRVQGKFIRDENTIEQPIVITLVPKRKGLTIKYTLDNSLPNEKWKVYAGPITLE
jgi:hexosaminidase